MKKAQLFGNPVIYIGILIIILLFVVWGITQINEINKKAEEAKLISFTKSLKNTLTTVKSSSFGDIDEKTFSLPTDVEELCFIDDSKETNDFTKKELNSLIKRFPEFNLFIFPSEKFNPFRMSMLRLSENPMCVRIVNGKIKLSFENKGDFAEINAEQTLKDIDCVSLVYNGEPEKKIDMVFLGYGYSGVEKFAGDVDGYINEQFSVVEPFKSNLNKINFYRIDSFNKFDCEITDLIRCNNYLVKQLASQCPNDYVFILAERNKIINIAMPVRSSSVGSTIKVNTADNSLVIMHEFGHALANLADEYVDADYYGSMDFKADIYPNCDISGCPKWYQEENVSCYEGCSLSEFFRPTENSIMRKLNTILYGPVNLKEIFKRLESYE